MNEHNPVRYAVAAIRASSVKQGTDGDSPEAQKEQIERFAKNNNITIKKYFVFLESASKEQQPMQEVVDYCKNPANGIDIIVIKSIDRFTRGGSYSYDGLKIQLDNCKVALVDIYGVISGQKVNTLEHLDFEYRWSVYSPSKKSEILEAERAKDEMRDIMSRMIGAEIRYTQIGYWMRQPPYGFVSQKIETQNGKRCILKPHETEAAHITRMFELCARGTLDDHQIADELNRMGFKTRVELIRDQSDRTKIVGQRGGKLLTAKKLRKYVQNPLYAGVIKEKWTHDQPIRAKFDGLVDFKLFNKANNGKIVLANGKDGMVEFYKEQPAEFRVNKGVRNPDFPYKKVVCCPHCDRPLLGSASRGKLGKYYPAYHCSNHGHYFRIPQKEFDETIVNFVKSITIAPERIEAVISVVMQEWEKRQTELRQADTTTEARLETLHTQARLIVDKIKFLNSETAIKYMEEDLLKIEAQIAEIEADKEKAMTEKPVDMHRIMAYVKYFMEHLDDLLIHLSNPVNRAAYFGVLFDKIPNYQEIKDGTLKIAQIPGVNELFKVANCDDELLVTSRRIELRLPG
jgi:site-specific DNA recombinase